MKIKISILDGKILKNNFTIPTIIECNGDYGLELGISKLVEIYYGDKCRIQVEEILKVKLSDEEILKNFTMYLER